MLNQKQIEIADFLLGYLDTVEGKSSRDDYPEKLRKNGFDYFDASVVIEILIDELGLLDHINNSDYWIRLTTSGQKAAKIGLEKYFAEIEQDKQLYREVKKANIDGVEKANKNAKRAIVIAIIIPVLIAIIQIYFDYRKNAITNGNNNGSVRPEINHSQLPLQHTDTFFFEELKNSLKHDTVFLNDIKNLINQNE